MRKILVSIVLLLMALMARAQQTIPLYNGPIPNSIQAKDREYSNEQDVFFKVSEPSLAIYLPSGQRINGTAVIICPGGGYGALWMKKEGWDVAKKLQKLGIAAFVLKYRLPEIRTMKDETVGPLQDAQKAIQIVRQRASEWNISPRRIGIMGFSAGGHLAASAGTHFDKSFIKNPAHINLRPDFMLLVYPVISMTDSLTHQGSRNNLLGKHPTEKEIDYFSNELQVTDQTPPAFLIQAEDDRVVTVKNSIRFYEALMRDSVAAGLHLFPRGDHGFPLEPARSHWFSYCVSWLKENDWLKDNMNLKNAIRDK